MREIIRAIENAIQILEEKAEAEGKHVIKTDSIKKLVPFRLVSGWIDRDTDDAYLSKCGFNLAR